MRGERKEKKRNLSKEKERKKGSFRVMWKMGEIKRKEIKKKGKEKQAGFQICRKKVK